MAPEFSVDDEQDVVEICRRLDGIPLAIELAASRISSMTLDDVRDRLDHRFKLLIGTQRGLERHQTLRQAVQWSYDLLDDSKKALLARCSVFSGGFDVQSACAVAGFDETDDFAVLDLLDALVRKSLLVTDRSTGRARFSMLETIRQFAEEQLAARGEAADARTAHARHFAGREADILALGDSPRQGEAFVWFTTELTNLRTAFRCAAEHDDVDTAAPIATCPSLLGVLVENYEPVAWTEELIEPACAVDHPRLAALYAMATQCLDVGRGRESVRYCEAGQVVFLNGREAMPPGFESWFGAAYANVGQPERSIEWSRRILARGADPYALAGCLLVFALMRAGSHAEAMAVAKDLVQRADAIPNPWARSFALLTYGMAFCDADPQRARDALRMGHGIAQGSGNRYNETHLANILGRLEAQSGDTLAALGYLTLAIRTYHDSGNTTVIRIPLAVLAALLHRLGRDDSAVIIAGYALSPVTRGWLPELGTAISQLREILGEQTYESLASRGKSMTTSAMAAYAYDQIDQVRTELEQLR